MSFGEKNMCQLCLVSPPVYQTWKGLASHYMTAHPGTEEAKYSDRALDAQASRDIRESKESATRSPMKGDVYKTEPGDHLDPITIVVLDRTGERIDCLVSQDPWYPGWHRRTLQLPVPERFVKQKVPQA